MRVDRHQDVIVRGTTFARAISCRPYGRLDGLHARLAFATVAVGMLRSLRLGIRHFPLGPGSAAGRCLGAPQLKADQVAPL